MRRYNDFVDLRDNLKWAFPKLRSGGTLPKLPPKNNLCESAGGLVRADVLLRHNLPMIAKFESKFLKDRQAGLQYWLRTVLLHDQMGSSEIARKWVLAN